MKMKRPNILFITTDQQRKDSIGCYGNHVVQTPNIDRLAAEGTRFERAYCESPICIPSRITMITGKACANHRAPLHNTSMPDNERTIGQVLQENGYRTHFAGKPHFKSQQHRGTEESIADWRDGKFDGWHGPYCGFQTVDIILGHSNSLVGHYGEWLRGKHPEAYVHFKESHLDCVSPDGGGTYRNTIPEALHSSAYVAMRTNEFLDSMKGSESPFYCFASFPDPHWPIMPPQPYFDMYRDAPVPSQQPPVDAGKLDNYPRQFRIAHERHSTGYDGGGHYLNRPEDLPAITRAYWGAVTFIDKNVGLILDKLDGLGMADNTIVVFTTDHGEYMGAHGMIAKGGFLWEEFINTPLIIRSPNASPRGFVSNAIFSFTDFVPTLLDMAGIDRHGLGCDGMIQTPVVNGGTREIRDNATIHHPKSFHGHDAALPDIRAIVTGRWKLIHYAGDPNGELYDLQEDPGEEENLYHHPGHRQTRDELTIKLLDQIILQNNKEAINTSRTADDYYGHHVMSCEMWKAEFVKLKRQTGRE
ncbi:MAG: sulfatase-like hydrolase/transferase [Victivallales bacterium]